MGSRLPVRAAHIDHDSRRQLSPELGAIIACIRAAFGLPRGRPRAESFDAQRFTVEAVRHGVGPLVAAGLALADVPLEPGARARLRASTLAAQVSYRTTIEPVIERALRALVDARLDPIVLKGGALGTLAYPEPYQRTMGDLDVIVPENQLDPGDAALRLAGFEPETDPFPSPHHLPPYRVRDSPFAVELHHQLMPHEHPFPIDLAALRARAQAARIAGVDVRVLAPEDTLVHVSVHLSAAHRYRLHPLRGLVDILAITTRWRDELDWRLVAEITRRCDAAGAVYWPLLMTRAWLGVEVPDRALERLAPPRPLHHLFRTIAEPAYILEGRRATIAGSDTLQELVLTWSLQTGRSPLRQAEMLVRAIFPPPDPARPGTDRAGPRHAAYLLSPARLGRAAGALARLLPRLVRPRERT